MDVTALFTADQCIHQGGDDAMYMSKEIPTSSHLTMTGNHLHTVPILGRNTEESVLRISVPVMTGYEATVRIRKSGVWLLIIAMIAYALKRDMELCLEKAVDGYIAKPVNR
ncbi:Hybrid signal transduction histidine kinase J [Fusarium oxysporum f. sp. cubense]|uniref:Hybrid signal transduction histidine kinase J n=1 Tax=Fusarium oxysporum f. sp. cubense TaxID=61366 RepID=A0A559KKR5_FUSOC|nr:Hybrid signal transduction histidine kinase J [Fusarium oxysporum f. sp. cubense]